MDNSPDEDAIRRRSYEIWEQEGRPRGKHLEHWFRAQGELRRKQGWRINRGRLQIGGKSICFWDYFG